MKMKIRTISNSSWLVGTIAYGKKKKSCQLLNYKIHDYFRCSDFAPANEYKIL